MQTSLQQQPPVQRRRKKPKPGEGHLPPATPAYNLFMKWELRRLYKEQPLTGRPGEKQDVMRRAAAAWHDSPMNPRNAPAEPPTPHEVLEASSPAARVRRRRGKRKQRSAEAGASTDAPMAVDSDPDSDAAVVEDSGEDEDEDDDECVLRSPDKTGRERVWRWLRGAGRWVGL